MMKFLFVLLNSVWVIQPVFSQFPEASGTAIIFGEDVNVREEAAVNTQSKGKLFTGNIVEITGLQHIIENPGQSFDCTYFPWVKIKSGDSLEGFVYGKYVYRFKAIPDSNIVTQVFSIGEEQFMIRLAERFDVGTSNDEGLTACEDFDLIVIYSLTGQKFHLLKSLDKDTYAGLGLSLLVHDFGVAQTIKKVENKPETVVLKVWETYMEGTGSFDLVIYYNSGKFYGRKENPLRNY